MTFVAYLHRLLKVIAKYIVLVASVIAEQLPANVRTRISGVVIFEVRTQNLKLLLLPCRSVASYYFVETE